MLTDAEILDQNPWWRRTDWEGRDPHLRRLRDAPRRLPVAVLETLDLTRPAIHTLRGPRQVGKSTALKLLAGRESRRAEPSSILYLALDLLEGRPMAEIARTVRRAKELAGVREGAPSLILLDEVTVTEGWQTAVKSLWDGGVIDRDVVVCTGSSSIDLASGVADRLPGRRGAGADHLMLPADFPTFARAMDETLPPSPGLRISDIASTRGRPALEVARAHTAILDRLLERYVVFGGLPAAVAEATTGAARPSDATIRIAEDSLLREIAQRGASETAAWALMERVLRSLGSRTSWEHMAREMGVPLGSRRRPSARSGPSAPTVREYVEHLAAAYLVLIVYAWRSGADAGSVAKQKKLYFADPLLAQAALRRAPGLKLDLHALVENVVALALLGRYEPPASRIGGFLAPDDLHYWVTRSSGEIDFVAGPRRALEVCEVKYRRHIDLRTVAKIPQALPERPVVVATHRDLDHRGTYSLVPASLFLWALGAPPSQT